ncbi:sulfatase [Lutibacter sp.]|uniref:sulfatase n=1 Tax=Lutibacter sp. TaxID=1925666 RepID=UPI0025C5324B|nr:sulfatase [Lutibacter sp.]
MRNPIISILLNLMLITVYSCKSTTFEFTNKPNIIIFMVDDLGWTDLGSYGSDFYETPAIDKIATNGIRFTNAYSASSVCSPTRAAIMTGKYPARTKVTDWIAGHNFPWAQLKVPQWKKYLDPNEITLPEYLKDKGYTTANIGKWHLGEESTYWPKHQGFDINKGGYAKGGPRGHYFSPYHNPRLTDGPKGEYLTDRLTDEAIQFMNGTKEAPFFLYFSHYAVHTKLEAKQQVIDKYKNKIETNNPHQNPIYAAMIDSVDESLKRFLQNLEETGKINNTIIFFMSDNGGLTKVTSNAPLRDGKGSIYEGGVKVPMIIYAPKLITKGSVNTTPTITMDVFASITDLLHIKTITPIDGISLIPLILEEKEIKRNALYWHYPHYHQEGAVPYSAIREGDWKLIENLEENKLELYHLSEDIGETKNLTLNNPSKAADLKQKLNHWRTKIEAQMPIKNIDYDKTKERKKSN